MKRLLLSVLAALTAGEIAALAATIPPFSQNVISSPNSLQDYNTLINTLNSNLPGMTFTFQPGAQTAVVTGKSAFYKVPRAMVVDTIEASAQTFTCSVNPVVTLFECGTSTTCASPTTIGSATVTAANTTVDGAISAPNITAGDYVAWATSAGTCTVLDIAGTAVGH